MKSSLLALAMLVGLHAQDLITTVFLTRHAERSGPALKDPITPAGQERAQLLVRMLGEAGVTKIFVSDALRTQQTAAPLAEKLHITPVIVKGAANGEPIAQAFRELPAGTVAYAARHSGEIESTVEKLGGGKLAPISELEYDRFLVLTLRNGAVVSVRTLRYGK